MVAKSYPKRTKFLFVILTVLVFAIAGMEIYQSDLFRKPAPKLEPKRSDLSQNLNTIISKAEALYEQGRSDESLQLYLKALTNNPNSSKLHNNIGLILLQKEQLAESEKHLVLAIELDPVCSECNNNFGLLETRQNKALEAEKHFKEAIILNDQYGQPYYNLGVLYEKNGDRGNAISAYEDFLRHSTDKKSLLYLQVENRILTLREK